MTYENKSPRLRSIQRPLIEGRVRDIGERLRPLRTHFSTASFRLMKLAAPTILLGLFSASCFAQIRTNENPVDKKNYVAPGGSKTYSSAQGVSSNSAPGSEKVSLGGVRLLQSQQEIDARTTAKELAAFTELVHQAASQVFAKYDNPLVLLVKFTCVPEKCTAEIASQGLAPDEMLQTYFNKLKSLKALRVSDTVRFQVTINVAPDSVPGAKCSDAYVRGGEPSKFDPIVHKALEGFYHLVDVDPAKREYISPKPTAGKMPPTPIGSNGTPIHGYVFLAYVVTTAGYAETPTIIETWDAELSKLAIAATKSWRFNPGKVDGAVVCTVAMQQFKF